MNTTLKFLKERLEKVEKRVAASDDYKEMKVLRRMIEEVIQEDVEKEKEKAPRSWESPKDYTNSPLPQIKVGKRISKFYAIVEKILFENNGEMEIDKLEEILREQYGMDWKDTSKVSGKAKGGRVSSYINIYNRKHPEEQTLWLWPLRIPGKSRVSKYTRIYLGKGKLSAAIESPPPVNTKPKKVLTPEQYKALREGHARYFARKKSNVA